MDRVTRIVINARPLHENKSPVELLLLLYTYLISRLNLPSLLSSLLFILVIDAFWTNDEARSAPICKVADQPTGVFSALAAKTIYLDHSDMRKLAFE